MSVVEAETSRTRSFPVSAMYMFEELSKVTWSGWLSRAEVAAPPLPE